MESESIIIIGGGFAGLSAGIYGQMNGYQTQIFEMHDKPGGLCTSWKRNGYTIDGCIHWLTGSSPFSSYYRFWEEVGVAQGRTFINPEEYFRHEGADGRTLIFYSDIDRLEKHLLEFSPQDKKAIHDFIRGIRLCRCFDLPSGKVPFLNRLKKRIGFLWSVTTGMSRLKKWLKITGAEFADRFKDPVLKEAFQELWIPDFSILFMMFAFGYLHNKNAGYPIGGSLPMSRAMEKRYVDLGGKIHYRKKVESILVRDGKAEGIRLEDQSEHTASRVISAADGYSTIFHMLNGKFADEKVREPYEKWQIFKSLLFLSFGINRDFRKEPVTVSGMSFPLSQPLEIAGTVLTRLPVHIYNQDPTLAPEGKSLVVVAFESEYSWWKKLDQPAYTAEKENAALKVIEALEQRFPGISADVEMTDIATPLTFERYTGNWKGSFEGWLITPGNADTIMKPMKQTLPGLQNFYMCGQWVEPGGGLPTSVMSARRLMKAICKTDGKKFRTSV